MKKNPKTVRFLVFFILAFLFVCAGGAQTVSETRVILSSFVEPKQAPLNRTVTWTVRVEWQDALSLIEIEDFEAPILSNFDIVGSSAANRRTADENGQISIKEIAYTLVPKTLGMGYIEPAAISYKDKATGEVHHLMTQRIGVEVTDPVPEPGERQIPWLPVLTGLIVIAAFLVGGWFRKRALQKKVLESAEDQAPLEEKLLAELKSSVDLTSPNRDESLSFIIKIFRKYVSEKYGIPALETTTSDLIGNLKESGMESRLTDKCEAMLSKADAIRFSGNEASPAELDGAYGTVEMVLESNLKSIQDKHQDKE